MLVNVKLDISGCNSITFEVCRLLLSSSFLMVQMKRFVENPSEHHHLTRVAAAATYTREHVNQSLTSLQAGSKGDVTAAAE